jgi:hypothetical protein
MRGQHEHRCVEPTPLSTPAWAPACLAALQGGQARRAARSSKPKHQNRALTARKQRFLTAVHTSNRVVQDWGKYLGDATMATTILDRLMHRAAMLEFEGKSYRLKEAAARLLTTTAPDA